MVPTNSTRDLAQTTFTLLVIGLLMVATFWVLYPFLPALIWAMMIVIASWPLMRGIQRRLWGSRTCAVIFMTIALLVVLILPLSVALSTVVSNFSEITEFARSAISHGPPEPPTWLEHIPLVGSKIARSWEKFAALRKEEIVEKLSPYIGKVFGWLLSQIGGLGILFLHFLLTVILSVILYAKGEDAARALIQFARRLAEDRGEHALVLASQAIRAVALGVIVTALIQSAMTGLGLVVAGVPYSFILSSVVFLSAVIQIGAGPVLLLVIIWLYGNSSTLAASVFLVWSILIVVIDNFVRPLLIKAGADLPLLLIFAGVIGGLISFGIIGLFIGPVVLAVSYTLLKAWVETTSKAVG